MICNTYVEFFKTIAEPSRVEILFLLRKNNLCVHEIVERLDKEQSAVSHNLRILRKKGFVDATIEGKHRRYSLTEESKRLLQYVDGYVEKYFHKDCKCNKIEVQA